MKTGIYPYDIVEVIWDDASAENGWEDPETKELEESLAMTIGFLVKKTRKHILIAHTVDEDNINGTIQIPKGMIKSIKVIFSKQSLGS